MSSRAPKLRGASPAQSSRRTSALAALGVFLLLFAVYHATLVRTVVDQDSGELVAAAHVLGIAHPTGYPLWVLLARGFDFLPVGGTSAYRVGLLSAVSTAAAGAIVTALAAGLTGALLPAIFAGLAYGLWFPAWSQAVRAEVYGLTALLVALALAAFFAWERGRSPKALGWFALAAGFVSMHHRTAMLMIAPALIAAAVLTRPRSLRLYAGVAGLFLAPFACYLYLPIRAAARPPVNWTNPTTWDRFWDHVLATQYQGYALSHGLAEMKHEAIKLLPDVLAPSAGWSLLLALIGVPLIVWGCLWWIRRAPAAAGSLAAGAALLVFWVLQWGETTDLKVFLLPLGAVLAMCGAAGVTRVAALLPPLIARRAAIAVLGVLVCGSLVRVNWERCDLSNLWQHRDRWVAVLSQLEPNAIFISDNDVPSFVTTYLQNVEGTRRDVTLIRVIPLQLDWYLELIQDSELREAVRAAWTDTPASLRQVGPRDPAEMQWDRTAYFAHQLAERLKGSRPVYALHGPWPFARRATMLDQPQFAGPPYFVGLSEDVAALRSEEPEVIREKQADGALAEMPGGVELVAFEWDRTKVDAGEVVGFRSEWRVKRARPGGHFAIGLRPEGVDAEHFRRELLPKGRFIQGFPLTYGLRHLGASPEGTVREQRGYAIIPTNAPQGTYRVAVGLGPPYTEQYEGWVEVGKLQVHAGPRPSNPP